MDTRQQRLQELIAERARRRGQSMINDQDQQPQQPGMGSRMLDAAANNPLTGAILGAGDAPGKLAVGLMGREFKPASEGLGYQVGNLGGNLGMMYALSELGGGAASRLPAQGAIGNLAKLAGSEGRIPSAMRTIASGMGLGAAESPEDRGQGALEGGLGGLAALGVGPMLKGAQKGLEYLNAPKYAKQLYGKITGGRSLEETAHEFSELVREGKQKAVDKYESYVKPVLDKFGGQRVFPRSYLNKYAPLVLQNSHLYGEDVKAGLNEFLKKGDFSSANELKKLIGNNIGELKLDRSRGALHPDDRKALVNFQALYGQLKKSLNTFLEKKDPEAALNWRIGSNIWKQKVVPYSADRQLRRISLGEEKNPANFHSIFQSPERQMQTVLNDIGEEGKRHITHSHVGLVPENLEVDRLANSLLNMKTKPALLESSMPKFVQKEAIELSKRDKAMNRAMLFLPQLRRKYFRPI